MGDHTDNEKDELSKLIMSMIPKSLDDIIRQNRHLATLTLTSEEEISELYFPIKPGIPKELLNNWSLITLNVLEQVPQVILVGEIRDTHVTRVTSAVQQIDFKNNFVITQNRSLYQLGNRNKDEPDSHQLMTICAVFHSWGFGAYLGVPHFFF